MSFSKNYLMVEQIGAGAMATVHRAIQKSLERSVAVKQILPHLAAEAEFVERFNREAKAAAGLRHENIVSIIDFGNDEDTHFIVVEYIDGPSLKDVIGSMEGKKVSLQLTISIITQILYGLEHSHNNGVIHRDIKPANIMFSSTGLVKVMDFGIAHAKDLPSLTTAGQSMGTPSYMSPEQAGGKKLDNRSDIFSVGVLFYEMLAGHLPFKGKSLFELIQSVMNDPHQSLGEIDSTLPKEVIELVDRALSKDPTRRFFDATEFVYALENFAFDNSIKFGPRVLKEYLETAFDLKEVEKEKFSTSQIDKIQKPTTKVAKVRPTVALLPLTGCFGCHVNLLDLHENFGAFVDSIDLKFSHLMDVKTIPEVDIGIVEGCVGNHENEERLKTLREKCGTLITLGTCACYGGIPGLRNLHQSHQVVHRAYIENESTTGGGVIPMPDYVPQLTDHVKAVSSVVDVDHEIPGCPSPRALIVSSLESLLSGTEIKMPTRTVCSECDREQRSLLVSKKEFIAPNVVPIMEAEYIDPTLCFLEQGILCMGMATREGCNSRCLTSNYPCQGCMGPAPKIRENGAKWINTLGSLLPSGAMRFRDDIVGLGYRYTLPISMMPYTKKV